MKSMKSIGFGLAAALLLAVLSGCSGSGNAENDNAENYSAGNDNESYAIPEDEQGSITFRGASGEEITASSVNERPEELPDEIPLPEDAVILGSFLQGENNNMVTLTFEAKQDWESVIELYESYTTEAGYETTMPVTANEEAYWFSGFRDTEQLVVILGKDLEREGYMGGTITYQNNQ